MFDTNVFAAGRYLPRHAAYTGSVTADLRDTYKGLLPDGDPHKLTEVLYQLVVGADEATVVFSHGRGCVGEVAGHIEEDEQGIGGCGPLVGGFEKG